jgi:hypothetical protein
MLYIEDYINERNKTKCDISYEKYLEHRLKDAEEKVKQLIEFVKSYDAAIEYKRGYIDGQTDPNENNFTV